MTAAPLPVDVSGFTEADYRSLVQLARSRFAFASFASQPEGRHVLWRHDVDTSVHRALALARIEAEEGVAATYFFMARSEFYNLFEQDVVDRVREIVALGHHVGVHFSFPRGLEDAPREEAERVMAWEAGVVGELAGHAPGAISFHNASPQTLARFDHDHLGGMVNAYSQHFFKEYAYRSDSNGYWRHGSLRELLETPGLERAHVLTHPEWWTPHALSPRQKIARSIDGRAQAVHRFYDGLMAAMGRNNVGRD